MKLKYLLLNINNNHQIVITGKLALNVANTEIEKHSLHSSIIPTPSSFSSSSLLNMQTVKAALFRQSSLNIGFS